MRSTARPFRRLALASSALALPMLVVACSGAAKSDSTESNSPATNAHTELVQPTPSTVASEPASNPYAYTYGASASDSPKPIVNDGPAPSAGNSASSSPNPTGNAEPPPAATESASPPRDASAKLELPRDASADDAFVAAVHERFLAAANKKDGADLVSRRVTHNDREWFVHGATDAGLAAFGNGISVVLQWDRIKPRTLADGYFDLRAPTTRDWLGAAIFCYRHGLTDRGDTAAKRALDGGEWSQAEIFEFVARQRGMRVPADGFAIEAAADGQWKFVDRTAAPPVASRPEAPVSPATPEPSPMPADSPNPNGRVDANANATARAEATEYRIYAGDENLNWKTFRPQPGVQRELADCRSISVKHETILLPGQSVIIDGTEWLHDPESRRPTLIQKASDGGRDREHRIEEEAKIIGFDAFGEKYGISVRVRDERIFVASAFGMPVKLGRDTGILVDSDLDGKLGTIGDGVVVPESKTVSPWHDELWTPDGAVALKRDAVGAWKIADIPMPHPGNADHSAAWRKLNWRRQQVGVQPCHYDAAGEADLVSHLKYCAAHNTLTHPQDPTKAGYSEAGHKAGMDSVLASGRKGHLDAFDGMYATMYHRDQMLEPAITHTAFGLHGEYWGMRIRYRDGGPQFPFVCPAHGMTNALTAFDRGAEGPMGIRNGQNARYPYTGAWHIDWFTYCLRNGNLPTAPTLELVALRGGREMAVPGDVFWPGNEPQSEVPRGNFGTIHIVPRDVLASGQRYRARIDATLNAPIRGGAHAGQTHFEYEWEFTTR